jgi:hypothetical protein
MVAMALLGQEMDHAGEQIVGAWLYGDGEDRDIVDDPYWTAYMMAHKDMRRQIRDRLLPALWKILDLKKLRIFPISERFHAEFPENSGYSGYALLHGSNKTVGDFLMTGTADVREPYDLAEGGYDIELDLRFRFNDIVDPNSNYTMDQIRSVIANVVSFGRAKDYRLSINWGSSCLAEYRKLENRSTSLFLTGYPTEVPRALRPLPRAKLDWVGSEVKRAKDIEAKIISQLKRRISSGDIAALVDQKRKLLWLFYALTSFMSDNYLERLTADRASDELVRLLHERISRQWRAEIIETLRGKRPQGARLEWRDVK